jgi:DNA-binding XRE family transcriptional regulator
MSAGGYIYAIGASGTALVKIGSTQRVEKRLKTLQTGQPFALQTLAAVQVETDVRRIERQVHAFLVTEHRRGEWFEVPIDEERLTSLVQRAMVYLAEQDAPKTPTQSGVLPNTLADRVRRGREKCGLTQRALGELVGQDQAYISRLERGEISEITVGTLERLADAFHVTTDYLLGRPPASAPDAALVAAGRS